MKVLNEVWSIIYFNLMNIKCYNNSSSRHYIYKSVILNKIISNIYIQAEYIKGIVFYLAHSQYDLWNYN